MTITGSKQHLIRQQEWNRCDIRGQQATDKKGKHKKQERRQKLESIIHPTSEPSSLSWGSQGPGAFPSHLQPRGTVHPGQVTGPSQGMIKMQFQNIHKTHYQH